MKFIWFNQINLNEPIYWFSGAERANLKRIKSFCYSYIYLMYNCKMNTCLNHNQLFLYFLLHEILFFNQFDWIEYKYKFQLCKNQSKTSCWCCYYCFACCCYCDDDDDDDDDGEAFLVKIIQLYLIENLAQTLRCGVIVTHTSRV